LRRKLSDEVNSDVSSQHPVHAVKMDTGFRRYDGEKAMPDFRQE